MCVQCVLQVSRTFTFKKLCQRSDVTLRQTLAHSRIAAAAAAASAMADQHDQKNASLETTPPIVEIFDDEERSPTEEHSFATVADATHPTEDDDVEDKCSSLVQYHLPVLDDADTAHILRLSDMDEHHHNDPDDGDDHRHDADVIEQHMRMSMVEGDEMIDMVSAVLPMDDDTDDMMADSFGAYSNDMCVVSGSNAFLVTVDASIFDVDGIDDETAPSIIDSAINAVLMPATASAPPSSEHIVTNPTNAQPLALRSFECDVCHKTFGEAKVLRRHLKIHSATKPHACTACDMSFAESSNLTKHMKRHSGELRNVVGKPNLCSVCGKRFKWASSLSKHMKHHTRHKILTCPYCPKYYVEARSLNIHVRGHTGEKPFVCEVCQKGFTQMGNLDKHMRVHTGEKPFVCPLCGKGFSQSGYVAIHMRCHTGERPYRCTDCGKGFAGSNTLAIHRRTHTGERPYACTVCSRRFARQETAVIHQRTHTGEKPHVCGVCHRGFTSSGHLTGHMRSHSGEKPHACELCGKRFAGTSSLKVHMRGHATAGETTERIVGVVDELQQQQQQHLVDVTSMDLLDDDAVVAEVIQLVSDADPSVVI